MAKKSAQNKIAAKRTTSGNAIVLEHVSKKFMKNKKEFIAVDDVSLTMPRGQIFGLLGPNGAGKTTTISMICTLLRPTSGTILLDGVSVNEDIMAARTKIGLVFQETTLDVELSGWQNLDFHARLFKVDDRKRRIDDALKLVGLETDRDTVVKQYSGGMKRRLEIARSIIHNPAFILLDEPTLGLDPVSRRDMWRYIKKLIEKNNVTVLLTTHYLEEAERLCSRIAIMDKGKIVIEGTPEELKARISDDTIVIALNTEKVPAKLLARMRSLEYVNKATADGEILTLRVQNASRHLAELIQEFEKEQIIDLRVKRPSLDDVFFHYTGHTYEEDAR